MAPDDGSGWAGRAEQRSGPLIERYREVAQLSRHMLAAARREDWEEVVRLEARCRILIGHLKEAALAEPLSPVDPVARRALGARAGTADWHQAGRAVGLSGAQRRTRHGFGSSRTGGGGLVRCLARGGPRGGLAAVRRSGAGARAAARHAGRARAAVRSAASRLGRPLGRADRVARPPDRRDRNRIESLRADGGCPQLGADWADRKVAGRADAEPGSSGVRRRPARHESGRNCTVAGVRARNPVAGPNGRGPRSDAV